MRNNNNNSTLKSLKDFSPLVLRSPISSALTREMFRGSPLCLLAAELNEWQPVALICSAGRRSNRRTKDQAGGQWRNTVGRMGN